MRAFLVLTGLSHFTFAAEPLAEVHVAPKAIQGGHHDIVARAEMVADISAHAVVPHAVAPHTEIVATIPIETRPPVATQHDEAPHPLVLPTNPPRIEVSHVDTSHAAPLAEANHDNVVHAEASSVVSLPAAASHADLVAHVEAVPVVLQLPHADAPPAEAPHSIEPEHPAPPAEVTSTDAPLHAEVAPAVPAAIEEIPMVSIVWQEIPADVRQKNALFILKRVSNLMGFSLKERRDGRLIDVTYTMLITEIFNGYNDPQ